MKKNNGLVEKLQAHSGEDMFFEMLKLMVQEVMEEEIERHVGAGRNVRTEERRGHRNGYKPRPRIFSTALLALVTCRGLD